LRLVAPNGCTAAFQAVGGSPVLPLVQGAVLPTRCPDFERQAVAPWLYGLIRAAALRWQDCSFLVVSSS
jgi:hypothetical protein